MWHGSEKRSTMHLANMDIKMAFDMARLRHIAKTLGDPEHSPRK